MAKKSKKQKPQKQNFSPKQSSSLKKKNGQHRKTSRPLLVIGLSAILIIAAIFAFDFENGQLKLTFAQDKATNSIALPANTPRLTVDQDRIDFGDVAHNTRKYFSFTVSNTGNDNLEFERAPYIKVVKGCGPPNVTIGSMVLKPGESTTVQSTAFMMHAGMDGPHDFAVHLRTNDPSTPDKVVSIISNWGP